MKHDKTKNLLTENEHVPGLFLCEWRYEIKDTKASLEWQGPMIPHEVWQQILSFFKWTYDKYKSESQVRLYVNVEEQTWNAWAYPQEANTSMTAKEIDNDASKEQRKMFDNKWLYFGTVHHHCSMSAFQSSTDTANEKGQDGLHITVGKMDEKVHDIHCRFYRKGVCFEPDMSWFFDVGDPIGSCPEAFRKYLPKDIEDKTARALMCVPSSVEFPKQWADNIIEPPRKEFVVTPFKPDYYPSGGSSHSHSGAWSSDGTVIPLWQRARAAWKEILFEVGRQQIEVEELEGALNDITLGAHEIVLKACLNHKVDGMDLDREMPANDLAKLVAEDELKRELAEEGKLDGNGEKEKPTAIGPGDPEWDAYMQQ